MAKTVREWSFATNTIYEGWNEPG